MAAKLISISFILAGSHLFAQSQTAPSSSDQQVLHFSKPANTILPMPPSTDSAPSMRPQSGAMSSSVTNQPVAPSSQGTMYQGTMYLETVPTTPVTKPANTIVPVPPSTDDAPSLRPQLSPVPVSRPVSNPSTAYSSQGTMYFEPAPATPELAPTIVAPMPAKEVGRAARKDTAQPDAWPEQSGRAVSRRATTDIDEMSRLRPVFYQAPMAPAQGAAQGPAGEGTELEYHLQLEPPGLQRVIRLDSEKQLDERLRQEARERPVPERIQFPQEPILSRERYSGRHFPHSEEVVEPNYLVYQRLYFQERNSERYGWDLGIVQPLVSAGAFYWDVATLPYHLATDPFRKYDSNAGECLPGDPVPYLLYPPALSMSGAVAEAGTIFVLLAVFP
jgi:hypothetical protein